MEKQTQKTDLWTRRLEEEGEGDVRESSMETYMTICKTDSQREFAL